MAKAESSVTADDWEEVDSDFASEDGDDDLSAADIEALEAEVAALRASEEQDSGQQGADLDRLATLRSADLQLDKPIGCTLAFILGLKKLQGRCGPGCPARSSAGAATSSAETEPM